MAWVLNVIESLLNEISPPPEHPDDDKAHPLKCQLHHNICPWFVFFKHKLCWMPAYTCTTWYLLKERRQAPFVISIIASNTLSVMIMNLRCNEKEMHPIAESTIIHSDNLWSYRRHLSVFKRTHTETRCQLLLFHCVNSPINLCIFINAQEKRKLPKCLHTFWFDLIAQNLSFICLQWNAKAINERDKHKRTYKRWEQKLAAVCLHT